MKIKAGKNNEKKDAVRLISLDDAADRIGLSVWTLRRWVCQGRLPSVKLGGRRLLAESTIETLVAKGMRPADCPKELRLA